MGRGRPRKTVLDHLRNGTYRPGRHGAIPAELVPAELVGSLDPFDPAKALAHIAFLRCAIRRARAVASPSSPAAGQKVATRPRTKLDSTTPPRDCP